MSLNSLEFCCPPLQCDLLRSFAGEVLLIMSTQMLEAVHCF